MFPTELVAIGYYTGENAEAWIDLPKFMCWLGHHAQKATETPPTSLMKRISIPRGHSPLPMGTLSQLPPSSSPHPFSSPLPLQILPAKSGRVGGIPSSPIRVSDSEQEDFPAFPPLPNKRKREESRPEPDTSDSDSDLVVKKKAKGKNARRTPKDSGNDGHQAITRQFRVPEIRDVQKVFSCWTVPQTDIEKDFAYRVDLTNDTREWLDPKNKPLSMAAIIKSEDQDSWGKGSAGSIKKPTKVLALDGVPCQVANHDCQGICICDQLDKDLLRSHERYAPDDNEMRELFEAERAVNVRETSSMAIRAAAFYSEIHSKPCPHLDNGVLCIGLPMNLDGKGGFIGCQNYSPGQPRSHRFITINRDVKEDLIRELLSNNGRFISDVNVDSESAICARALHPRSGGKGDRLCPYTHIDQNHQVIKGKIIRRPCGAKIQIFSPIDHEDRRAMVYLTGSHNHPKFPATKNETYEVFKKMWPGLFETIARITDSEVKFKFIDGEGLKAILVDGNKPQANALGDYLVSRNRPHFSGIHEKDPKLILPNILRTCITHANRKFTSMALIVPDEPMSRIRRCPFIKTQQEMDEFVQWCKDSEYKVVRDWIADKDSIPWFFPSINEFLSKMPEEDWYLTPGDTNLNESAHPYTNQHTGTNLALLEAIDRNLPLLAHATWTFKSKQSIVQWKRVVLVNRHNTKPQRDRNNASRRTTHYRQALERSEARTELENLEDSIQESAANTKELRERRKALKEASGIKKTKRSGEKAKETLPDADEFAGLSDAENIQSSPVHPALHLCNDVWE
ncbi:hypothetical protein K438DRAFT_1968783 [Mycena galopus ATCC 62051]|nr:hypothetical protein K438DRAFT_1968783 [Mycena galopus ATCC 62051]